MCAITSACMLCVKDAPNGRIPYTYHVSYGTDGPAGGDFCCANGNIGPFSSIRGGRSTNSVSAVVYTASTSLMGTDITLLTGKRMTIPENDLRGCCWCTVQRKVSRWVPPKLVTRYDSGPRRFRIERRVRNATRFSGLDGMEPTMVACRRPLRW